MADSRQQVHGHSVDLLTSCSRAAHVLQEEAEQRKTIKETHEMMKEVRHMMQNSSVNATSSAIHEGTPVEAEGGGDGAAQNENIRGMKGARCASEGKAVKDTLGLD